MKHVLILCLTFTFFCSFASTDPVNPKTVKRSDDIFMLGFEIFRTNDHTPLNHTDILIEIYDHEAQKTIYKRDYREMPSNKFSSITYFEKLPYDKELTILISAPNFFAKEIHLSYDSLCALNTIFCIEGLDHPPADMGGDYADRYLFPITLDSITVGEELVLPNIYYEYNSAELRTSSFWVLDSLSKIIEHTPEIAIELGGHADARGGDDYNLDLSQRRVSSVLNYLSDKIGSDIRQRIRARGYGESQLLNECGNGVVCDESLHQKNRRTTFKIVKKIKQAKQLTLEEKMKLRAQKKGTIGS